MWEMTQAVDSRSHVTYSCYVAPNMCVIMEKDGGNDPGNTFLSHVTWACYVTINLCVIMEKDVGNDPGSGLTFTCDVGFLCCTSFLCDHGEGCGK